ncbi:MAG: VWA domain-containing protein [Deltaproteobacteria bacterium]|nr:VWA domain-containing protein [Deltaproteobacteria bacterium]MBW2116949.1 VWA domain-containing protein [Deltaproteobacteria bacterium]MBW2342664.1 VWA domain-containing protein [Deltaproteobacteria bacterium]
MKQNCTTFTLGTVLLFSLLVVFSVAGFVGAQPIERLTINYIEASAVPEQGANEVRAYVTVSDADDNPIPGLSEPNFVALEDGRKISIENASQTTDPMAIVLTIDTSGSMQAQDKSGQTSMEAAKMAAMDFISMLSEDDRIAIYSFNNESILKFDFSTDHAAAADVVNGLAAKPNAATRLYDTTLEAVKKTAEIPKGRRAIILLTDGKDEKAGGKCSSCSSNDVIDAATTKAIRVPIYTIGVGPQVDARELGRMASLTGGRSLLASSLDELPGFYQTIANQLKNQYLIKYMTRTPSGEHSLVVKALHEDTKAQDEKRFWSPPLPVMRAPTIKIVGPRSADQVRGTVTVRVSIDPVDTVVKVRYYVDAALKEERIKAPFDTFKWNTAGLSGGLHVLRIEAVDVNGKVGTAEITAKVKAPPALKPGPVPIAEETKGIRPIMIWGAALILLLALIACGALWWFRLRQKEGIKASTPTAAQEHPFEMPERLDGDETQFMPDFGVTGEAMVRGENGPTPLATLKVVKSMNLDPGKVFEVNIGTTTIGRTSANDIFIPDKPVSRKHAEITFDDGTFYIRDLGSKNGTQVDGEALSSEPEGLSNGANIHLSSKTILEFNVVVIEEEVGEDEITKISKEEIGEDDATRVYDD